MPDIHSKVVGSSTAYRRLNCFGSQELEAKVPDDGGSAAAKEGQDLHLIMENWIGDGEEPEVGKHYSANIPALTQEQYNALEWCFEIADPLVGENEFELEQYLELPSIPGAGGTGDVAIFNDDDSYTALDYKFGRGVPVYADSGSGRAQLLFVAATLRAKYGPAHTYHLHILQPRLDSHTHISVADHEVQAFETQLINAIEAANDTYSIGPWCKFCKGTPICPAKRELAQNAYQWGELGRKELPAALAIVDEVEEWAKEVRKLAHKALEAGGSIQGWKIVDKRATRYWTLTDDAIRRKLARSGLKIDQYAPRKTITPAQAEKLKFTIRNGMTDSKSSGTTLVRADDPRPSVGGPEGSDLQALADVIKQTEEK